MKLETISHFKEPMIREAFLIAALALPVPSIHHGDDGGNTGTPDFTRFDFLKEYEWLLALLERKYPGHEFMILPVGYDITPPGWIWVPFGWRSHLIYRREKEAA